MRGTSQTPTPGGVGLTYVPALDGLRGISLPGTMLTHFALFLGFSASAPRWLRSVGPLTLNIQMFFVLSGALITSLLVGEHQRSGQLSLKRFYLRRSRRLGPALLATVVVMGLVEVGWRGSPGGSPLGAHAWLALGAVAVFLGNWVLFSLSGGLGWLGPAWTLGIEEQFYLTWPVLLRAALRRKVRRGALYACFAAVAVMGLVASGVIESHVGKWRAFYATPVQLPSILCGCVLGYELTTNPDGRVGRLVRSPLVALAGLAGMVVTSIELVRHPAPLYVGGYAVYAVFACLLIGHCFARAGRPTVVTRALGWKPFVVVGQVSYEAYLVHVIVIIGIARALPGVRVYPMMALDCAVIAALSGAFYYAVERPIRRRGWTAALTALGQRIADQQARAGLPARRLGLVTAMTGVAVVVAGLGLAVVSGRTAPVRSLPAAAAAGSSAGGPDRAAISQVRALGAQDAPTVTGMVAASGPVAGGSVVTIRGRGFAPGVHVYFGSVEAATVRRLSPTRIEVVAPPAAAVSGAAAPGHLHGASVPVTVRGAASASPRVVAGRFRYR